MSHVNSYKGLCALFIMFFIAKIIFFLCHKEIDSTFLSHSKYGSCEISYYKESPRKLEYYNMKARYLDKNGLVREVGVNIDLRNYRDTINHIGKQIFILEDTINDRVKVFLCPSDAQDYQVPYDTFVKYCGDTLFWKEKCEEDWYYYK